MVPPGGAHISHPETAHAAQILGIDYADAVTGFAFKGRHGTAVITGAVVAVTCREAVEDVIRGLEDEAVQQEEARRSLEAVKMWGRLLKGLRIRARIEGYEIEGERVMDDERIKNEEEEEDEGDAGGFLPDAEGRVSAELTAEGSLENLSEGYKEDEGGGFLPEAGHSDGGGGGGFVVSDEEDVDYADEHDMKKIERPGSRNYNHYEGVPGSHSDGLHNSGVQMRFTAENLLDRVESGTRLRLYGSGSENGVEDEVFQDAVGWEKSEPQIPPRARLGREEHPRDFNVGMIRDSLDTRGQFKHNEENESSLREPRISTSHPNLADDELAEALMLQQLHENNRMPPLSPTNPNHPTGDESPSSSSHVPEIPSPAAPNPPITTDEPRKIVPNLNTNERDYEKITKAPENSEGSEAVYEKKEATESGEEDGAIRESNEIGEDSEEDDAGSLLSHDPSDEDADPEWLA